MKNNPIKNHYERKRLEKLNDHSPFNELLLRSPAIIAILKGKEFTFEMANYEYLQLIGKKNIIGKKLREVLPELENQEFLKLLENVYRTGQSFSSNEMQVKIDVEENGLLTDLYLYLILQPYKNDKGEVEGIFFFANNITNRIHARSTEKKLTKKRLQDSERDKLAITASKSAVWDLNLKTSELYWSEEYELHFGYSIVDTERSFKSWIDRIHPDDFERVYNGFIKIISGKCGVYWEDEYRFIKADGAVAFVYDRGNIICDKQGNPIRFIGVMQDITLNKEIETGRQLLIKELTKSNLDLMQFSLVASHNLRSPISNILSVLDIIDYSSLDASNYKMLEMLKVSSKQIQTTINDLSDILIIKNNINIKIDSINLEKLLNEIKVTLCADLHNIGAAILTDFQIPELTFNKTYLDSIFLNLISNAIKYRSAKRKLVINISSSKDDGDETLIFSDNGMGIDLGKHKNKVFGLYQRFSDETEGHGLGLFIIKSQITALGGNIEIESEVDKGSSFIITLKRNLNKPV